MRQYLFLFSIRGAILMFSLFFILSGVCAAFEPDRFVKDGKQALGAGEYEQALRLFMRGARQAKNVQEKRWQADFYFYMGLTQQQKAESLKENPERRKAFTEAVRFYEKALDFHPDLGAALNNIAHIYDQMGLTGQAFRFYLKAIELNDKRRSFYEVSYADSLFDHGELQKALKYYRRVLKFQPDNSHARKKIIDVSITIGDEGLIPFLWELMESGWIIEAQRGAMQALIEKKWSSRYDREELLALTVVGLSRQTYDPRKFVGSEAGNKFSQLSADPALSREARDIIALHQLEKDDFSEFSHWSHKGDLFRDPSRGVWPRDAFLQLIRSLGDRYRGYRNFQQAETYYLLATTLDREVPDPTAVLRLADLYIAQGDQVRLEKMMAEHQISLFKGKARAYRNSHLHKIYQYHRALGVIYANIDNWGDSRTSTSAIFQLEHAIKTAQVINRRNRRNIKNSEIVTKVIKKPEMVTGLIKNPEMATLGRDRRTENKEEQIIVEPRLVKYLADGYELKSQPDKAIEIQLDAAETLIEQRAFSQAVKVLVPLATTPPAVMTEIQKERYLKIRSKIDY